MADFLSASARKRRVTQQIILPQGWSPRWYQARLFGRLDSGIKRAVCVWHRRAGKDVAMINYAAMSAFRRVGTYWHVFPTQKQARKAIWEGITSDGKRIIDQAFPPSIVKRKRDDEMMIELVNGSIWRLVGGDNYDSLVGSNVVGVVYSEAAITDPAAWTYVRPILAESGGWAVFISTPRGKNWYFHLYEMALRNPEWHAEVLRWNETGAIQEAAIEAERRAGMTDEEIEQEFGCSFEAGSPGVVYQKEIGYLEKSKRIGPVPFDPTRPVETSWDIGLRDSTAIWFFQRVNKEVRVIDYYVNRNQKLPHYLEVLRSKPYSYTRHIGPHDIDREGFATDPIIEIARNFGVSFTVAPKFSVAKGIEATRALLQRAWIDEVRCHDGLQALKSYHFEWDPEKKMLGDKPVHDWSSHGADAIRTYAVTPEEWGTVPRWMLQQASDIGTPRPNQLGHNGGPPLEDYVPDPKNWAQGANYDPLASY